MLRSFLKMGSIGEFTVKHRVGKLASVLIQDVFCTTCELREVSLSLRQVHHGTSFQHRQLVRSLRNRNLPTVEELLAILEALLKLFAIGFLFKVCLVRRSCVLFEACFQLLHQTPFQFRGGFIWCLSALNGFLGIAGRSASD